jgi:hypothetical protein
MRKHFVSHWRIWLAIAVIVIVANEMVDRNFFDHREHIEGDVVLVVLVFVIAFFGSYFVARSRQSRRPGLVQRGRELPPEARAERVLRPELIEERDHEPAQLVPALRVRLLAHLGEEELERRLVVAGLERGEQLGPLARLA